MSAPIVLNVPVCKIFQCKATQILYMNNQSLLNDITKDSTTKKTRVKPIMTETPITHKAKILDNSNQLLHVLNTIHHTEQSQSAAAAGMTSDTVKHQT